MPTTHHHPPVDADGTDESMELLTLEQAAAFLGPAVSIRWLRRQVHEFGMPAFQLNRRLVIRKRDLIAYVEAWRADERAKASARLYRRLHNRRGD